MGEAASRLRFPAIALRPAGPAFQTVASATLQWKKIWIEYHARGTDERSERTVSPQRVTHYRESWYLDAWDEGKAALRSFAIDRIVRVTLLDQKAGDPAARVMSSGSRLRYRPYSAQLFDLEIGYRCGSNLRQNVANRPNLEGELESRLRSAIVPIEGASSLASKY